MIINPSYFIGKINLPQTGNSTGAALVQDFINQYEPEYLQRVLGYDLWKAFSDGIGGSGPEQRFVDLLEGKTFQSCGQTKFWPGFEAKPSAISQFVYYQFLESNAEDMSLVGAAVAETDNAQRVNPVAKMISAWNVMVELNYCLAGFLNANADVYPEWRKVYFPDGWWNAWLNYSYPHEYGNELFSRKNSLDL